MRIINRSASMGWIGTAAAALFLASTAVAFPPDDKAKPASSHQSTPQRPAVQRSAPSHETHTSSPPARTQTPPPQRVERTPQQRTPSAPVMERPQNTPPQRNVTDVRSHERPSNPPNASNQPNPGSPNNAGNNNNGRIFGNRGNAPNQPNNQPNPRNNQPNPRMSTPTPNQPNNQPGARYNSPYSNPGGARTSQPTQPGGGNRPNPSDGRVFGRTAQPNNSTMSTNSPGRPGGYRVFRTQNGAEVQKTSTGQIRQIRTSSGATIYHSPAGVRRVEVVHTGGRVVVANSYSRGYVQRPIVYSGHQYVQRTYIYGGRTYVNVYRPYRWGGVVLNVYTPVHYYPPAYYSWVYSPWRPVRYSWWWAGDPWYGYYGVYFRPYPVYTSPVFWLTDFMVAATLRAAYEDRLAAAQAAAPPAQNNFVQITPEVKQAIADEVQRQLSQERTEMSQNTSQPVPLGGDGPHVFVVNSSLEVTAAGQECLISEGDVLKMNAAPASNSEYADVFVLHSKGGGCPAGATVTVAVADLQEMQNHMREAIDQGMGEMRNRQGQGGIPQLPAAAAGPVTNASFTPAVQPDSNAQTELTQAYQEGSRAEQDAIAQPMAEAGGNSPDVALGMTMDEVVNLKGKPNSTYDAGSKKIYVYGPVKLIFVDGRLTDIQ